MGAWLRAWFRAVLLGEDRILAELRSIRRKINEIGATMATQAQVDALTTRVDTAVTAVDTGVTNIRADIEALKASNPGIDVTALEASVSRLEAEVTDVSDLDAENPVPPTP